MVISQLIGGLGNQMFQYAAGRALALRNNAELRLDVSGFVDYRLHQGFELQRVFSCPARTASVADVRQLLGWQAAPALRRIVARPRFAPLRRRALVIEPHFDFWPAFKRLPDGVYLAGYWQSEKYFADHAATLRADFTFRAELDARNLEVEHAIRATNAISLHIRRGDYASNPRTLATHGLCSLDYYRAAVGHIAERVRAPQFFVFSDDIPWARGHLNLPFTAQFIDHNQGPNSHLDMQLMSLCKHHIIANSSFSWWGAWLSRRADKIVVAPRQWFASDAPTPDLVPAGWVRL